MQDTQDHLCQQWYTISTYGSGAVQKQNTHHPYSSQSLEWGSKLQLQPGTVKA